MASGGRTETVKVLVVLWLGVPSSMARTVTVLVVLANPIAGFQTRTPFVELMVTPTGACEQRANVSFCAGTSGSVAELVTISVVPA